MTPQASPKTAWLTVNRQCNFRCKWCYAQGTDYNKDEMSLDLAKELSRFFYDIGIKRILLIGGEPSLWSYLKPYNEYIKGVGIKTSMVTNGYIFGTDKFWDDYKESPYYGHGISLKAGNSDQLKELTGAKNFNTLKKGITRLAHISEAGVSITYSPFYSTNLDQLVEFAISCGVKQVKIDFCRTFLNKGEPVGKYVGNLQEIVQDIVRVYDRLNEITQGNLIIEMSLPFCLWPADFLNMLIERNQIASLCHVFSRNGIIFDTNGKLLLCNALFDYPIGEYKKDFYDKESFFAFVEQPHIRRYYEKITSYPSQKCVSCDWYQSCGGGCPLTWTSYNPDEIVKEIKL